ncbi:hypothetical protein BaRGS_00024700, partial [Batillaria attramentaria]
MLTEATDEAQDNPFVGGDDPLPLVPNRPLTQYLEGGQRTHHNAFISLMVGKLWRVSVEGPDDQSPISHTLYVLDHRGRRMMKSWTICSISNLARGNSARICAKLGNVLGIAVS